MDKLIGAGLVGLVGYGIGVMVGVFSSAPIDALLFVVRAIFGLGA